MIVIIDNYDSFTYNLAHLVKELGATVDVLRNDRFSMEELERYDRIILSPGPGVPEEAGLMPDVIRTYAGKKPILGVCLGEQAIGQVFGGRLVNLSNVFHGVQTDIRLTEPDYIFRGLPREIPVGRYHSWVVDAEGLPETLAVTAVSPEGQIMALKHREYDVRGIQFHPESVLTPDGKQIMKNWLDGDALHRGKPRTSPGKMTHLTGENHAPYGSKVRTLWEQMSVIREGLPRYAQNDRLHTLFNH